MKLFRRRSHTSTFVFSPAVYTGQGIRVLNDVPATLARYTAERSRGIVHTPEWAAAMTNLQREHDHATYRGDRWMEADREATNYALLASDAEQRIGNAIRVAEAWEQHVKALLSPEEAAEWTTISNEVVDALNGLETRLPDGTTIPATTQEQQR